MKITHYLHGRNIGSRILISLFVLILIFVISWLPLLIGWVILPSTWSKPDMWLVGFFMMLILLLIIGLVYRYIEWLIYGD